MPRRNLIWIAILLAMAAVLLLVWRQPRVPRVGGRGEFGPVEQTYRVIREQYYQPVDAKELQRSAVRGMVGRLDEFSTYVSHENAQALTDRILGAGRDLGLEWTLDEKGLLILGPRPDSPAHKARLFRGDRVTAINEKAIQTLAPKEIRSFLSPRKGQSVALTILDADTGQSRPVRLTPEAYPVETVQGLQRDATGMWQYRLGEKVGVYYLRIPEFCSDTARQLGNVLRSLGEIHGIVLDLRDNPGGVLSDGVAVADLFLRDGSIVHVLARDEERQTHRAHADTPYADVPMVVLIDEKTTSAAEIVAGALAANTRAVLLGRRTRGKGCVQTMIRLPNELGQIHLTTAEFLVPPDQPIQRRRGAKEWGVAPQVTLKLRDDQATAIRKRRRELCVLPRPEKSSTTRPATQSSPPPRAWNADPQLMMAEALLNKPRDMEAILDALAAKNRRAEEAYRKKLEQQERRAKTDDKNTK
ncbi:MAG: PDZ domain-containing protein [Phycisphaerae bacterium]|nr:PDZ domain-containing protein [Phycisphaerae bacterium]